MFFKSSAANLVALLLVLANDELLAALFLAGSASSPNISSNSDNNPAITASCDWGSGKYCEPNVSNF
uniref:Uncharacterized protein n=1 Tax=Glossina palpalis gambiensis TaxID=67801 RepID=A0A1B0AZE7_9MUSC